MIKSMQRKMVWTTMAVLVPLCILLGVVVRYTVIHICENITVQTLRTLAENRESLFQDGHIELTGLGMNVDRNVGFSLIGMPIYAVELAESGEISAFTDFQSRGNQVEAEMAEAIRQIAAAPPGDGWAGEFRYYKIEDGGAYAVLTDGAASLERTAVAHLDRLLLYVALPILLGLFLMSVLITHFAIKPAKAALQKQKQFISDAGHELKTPLSAINVNAAVLEAEAGPSKYMDCIKAEALRMDGLVRRLLDVAYVEDANRKLERERFSLSETVYQATLPFESTAFERNIRYEVQIQENCTYVGEAARISQVVAILLDNAFKYGEEGGEVSIRMRRDGRRFLIDVFNTGKGISKADMPHIFERFYRCDKSRPGNGSYGLGLAIAQAIVQASGGSLTAESEEGSWAKFRVVL